VLARDHRTERAPSRLFGAGRTPISVLKRARVEIILARATGCSKVRPDVVGRSIYVSSMHSEYTKHIPSAQWSRMARS
jgi:hypothetical protein